MESAGFCQRSNVIGQIKVKTMTNLGMNDGIIATIPKRDGNVNDLV
jgi:hypothetical protein